MHYIIMFHCVMQKEKNNIVGYFTHVFHKMCELCTYNNNQCYTKLPQTTERTTLMYVCKVTVGYVHIKCWECSDFMV